MAHRFSNDPTEVSARMRLIRSKDTKPELRLFSILTEAGVHFLRHVKVGNIVVDALAYKRLVIFVDSPFWHLRDINVLQRLSRYWQQRLSRNRARDRRQERRLRRMGYSVVRFWTDSLDSLRVLGRIKNVQRRAKERAAQSRARFLRHKKR